MLKRISDLQQAPKLLCSLTDEDVALQGTGEYPDVFGTSDVGGKVTFGKIFAREAGSNGSAPIVKNDGGVVKSISHG